MKVMVVLCLALMGFCGARAQDRSREFTSVLGAAPARVNAVVASGLRLELRGVYVLDGLLWFSLRVRNGSVIDWRGLPMRFSIRDKRVLRRRARQELPLAVVARRESLWVPADSTVALCYGLVPRLPGHRQQLVLEYGERNGDRRLSLRVQAGDILKAQKLNDYANREKTL
jgi:hypothetical protein